MAHAQSGAFFMHGARGADNSAEDSRVLAAVFQEIMPVLARIQMRSPQPTPGSYGQQQTPAETVAAVALVSDLGADSLRRLTAYLDANAGKFEGLENCAPLIAAAARAFAARDYGQAFTLIFDVYRTIAMLRAADGALPFPSSIKTASLDGRDGDETRHFDGDGGSSGAPH